MFVHSYQLTAVTYLLRHHSLVLRFVKDQFDDYRESTIGGEKKPHFITCTDRSRRMHNAVTLFLCVPPKETELPVCLSQCRIAAFLTQTISLDDATTVKFEIW